MLELTTIKLLQAMQLGIASYVFVHQLCLPGMIFHGWYRLLLSLPTWLAKPLGMCDRCLSGQLALWYYLLCWGHTYSYAPTRTLAGHVLFVCMAIFFSQLIGRLMKSSN